MISKTNKKNLLLLFVTSAAAIGIHEGSKYLLKAYLEDKPEKVTLQEIVKPKAELRDTTADYMNEAAAQSVPMMSTP